MFEASNVAKARKVQGGFDTFEKVTYFFKEFAALIKRAFFENKKKKEKK